MPAHMFDRSSKWMLQHHGNAILQLGGAPAIRAWRALASEVVQPRQLPDGLLEVHFERRSEPDLVVVEVATYADQRIRQQALDDLMLVFQDRRRLPELLTLILRPHGRRPIRGRHLVRSRLGWTQFQCNWRVVELWTVPAEELLAVPDVGVIPWVPLAHFDGPPETLLHKCRRRIERQAPSEEHANLLAVTQVLAGLRYNDAGLLAILGGSQAMIESPLIQELVQRTRFDDLTRFLEGRFGPVPAELTDQLRQLDEERLEGLMGFAGSCPDLAAFQARVAAALPARRRRKRR